MCPGCGGGCKMIVPREYRKGGKVGKRNIPAKVLKKGDVDTVYARLQPGEIVIPKRHAPEVRKMLIKSGIRLPGL
jgi:hypothetical protein